MMRQIVTRQNLVLLLLLAAAYMTIEIGCRPEEHSQSIQQRTQELLRMVAVHELILQEAVLDIITKAQIDEGGNPVLYFVSAGAFGNTKLKQVLFRGCIQIRYGVDMSGTVLEVTSDGNGTILLKLPEPKIIGNPVVLTEPPCQSRILDVTGEGWWAGRIARAEVQHRIHQEYVKNAARLCDGLGLEGKTKERAEQVLRAFLKPVLNGKNLVILWEKGSISATKEQGDNTHGNDNNPETISLDGNGSDGSGMGDVVGKDVVSERTGGTGNDDYNNGLVGNALFRIPPEPVCRLQNGGIRQGESSGVCVGR